MPSFLNALRIFFVLTINLSVIYCIINIDNANEVLPVAAREESVSGKDSKIDFANYELSSILEQKNPDLIDGFTCDFSFSECTYKNVAVKINNIPNTALRKKYIVYISLQSNTLIPEIYQILHPGSDIADEALLKKIVIADDAKSNLAYTKIKFQNLFDSKYDKETGVYLGSNDFNNNLPGVLVHELTHYLKVPRFSDNFNELMWIEEGVSDYVFNKLGYSDKNSNRYPHCQTGEDYKNGYMCAADFFIFIEQKYQKNIPQRYVYTLENGVGIDSYDEFIAELFKNFIGKDVNILWNEYLTEKNAPEFN